MSRPLIPLLSIREVVAPQEPESGLLHQHHHYIEAATAKNTQRAYRSPIRHFERWADYLPNWVFASA